MYMEYVVGVCIIGISVNIQCLSGVRVFASEALQYIFSVCQGCVLTCNVQTLPPRKARATPHPEPVACKVSCQDSMDMHG